MPKPQDYSKRSMTVEGWKVNLISYRLGPKYHCTVDNDQPRAWLAKTEGATKEEAETRALARARELLAKTRRFPVGKKVAVKS